MIELMQKSKVQDLKQNLTWVKFKYGNLKFCRYLRQI